MRRPLRMATALAAGLATTMAMTLIATAQDSTTGTVNVGGAPIRSISVSPGSFDFDTCSSGGSTISFPNDQCFGQPLFVTNGDVPSTVHVGGTAFEGSAGGAPWQLCTETECSDGTVLVPPGPDQVLLVVQDDTFAWTIDNELVCHGYWDPDIGEFGDCAAGPNQQIEIDPLIWGPESTANASPSFATVITWSALP